MSFAARVEDAAVLSLADYTVACICPLGVECAAVEAMLDEIHDPLPTDRDHSAYTFGRLGKHNVVVAVMPHIGNNTAATTATQLLNDFPSLRFGLLVGIGGGVPGKDSADDVRLGDVVVSQATDVFGGVVQYDLGKKLTDGRFQRIGHLNKPPDVLSGNVKRLDSQHRRVGSQVASYLDDMLQRYPKMRTGFRHPGLEEDNLFTAEYTHGTDATCKNCDHERVVPRRPRPDVEPRIHYGTIGSANVVVKDAITRDLLRKDTGILCVEMEAAGLMDTFPCLVIRGICDYADSHKNKRWQPYAAATAAAYMKELLTIIPTAQVTETVKARELTQATLDAARNTEIQVNKIHIQQEETRQAAILSWISTTPYAKHYETARAGLLANSCQWLFRNPEFAQWLKSDQSGLFWLRGKPGAGKTKLCAMLVETLTKEEEYPLYFFCSRSLNGTDRQNPTVILRTFIHQLSVRAQRLEFPKLVRAAFDKRHSSGMGEDGLGVSDSHEMIAGLVADRPRTVIIIDGLDECSIEDRTALLESLQNLIHFSTTVVRVFISSRAHRDIVVRLNHCPAVAIEEALTRDDMQQFVQAQLTRSIQMKYLLYGDVSTELEQKIATQLVAKANGMFLWVRLQLQLLCQMQTEYQVLSSLDRLPPTLTATYDQIYDRITSGPSAYEAQKALAWLMCARTPLVPLQWAHAASWSIYKRKGRHDGQPMQFTPGTLLGMCQDLVVHEEMQDYITFAHVSVREYLEAKPVFSSGPLEVLAAEACLRFLISTRLPLPSQLEYAFYKYSARYWIDHVKECEESVPAELDEFLGTQRAPTPAYREWKGAVEVFGRRYREYHYADEIGTLTNSLLLSAYYGIRHTRVWKPSQYDPNTTDERGLSLLALASQNGQGDIVHLLVRNGAIVNPPRASIDSKTAMCAYEPRHPYSNYPRHMVDECHPLFLAIKGGHPDVVMLLLQFGAAFESLSAFMVAAGYGPPSVFWRILEQGSPSELSGEALVQAAMNKAYPQTFKAALKACADTSITGAVIQAVLEHREDKQEIITQLLMGRITARVLTGIWRNERLLVLRKLLDWIPDLPITAGIIRDLARDALPGEDCVLDVLKALLPDGLIDASTLMAVFRVGDGAVLLLEVLLKSRSYRDSRGRGAETHSEPLEALFEKVVLIPLTEDVAIAAMHNPYDALKLGRLLFSKGPAARITESMVEAAAGNEGLGAELLEFLFSLGCEIPTTDAVLAAAARNRFAGRKLIDLLVSKTENLRITDSVIEAAAKNNHSGAEILGQLLDEKHAFAECKAAFSTSKDAPRSRILEMIHAKNRTPCVSESAVVAAVGSGSESVKILEILLARCPYIPVTERVLTAASKNTSMGLEVMGILLGKCSTDTITESVVSAAVQNFKQSWELVDILLTRVDSISVSDKLISSALRYRAGSVIISKILDSGKCRVEISAVRLAAIKGQTHWFHELFAKLDNRLIRKKYGSIFLAAIEGGNPEIFERCMDLEGLWGGTDEHGWSAELMAYHKQDVSIREMLRREVGLVRAHPREATSWEVRDDPTIKFDGMVLHIDGDDDTHKHVRGNHPFAPTGTSYFEIEIVELRDPKKPTQGTRDSIAIGAIDEFLKYQPAYYTDTGYMYDVFLMRQTRSFRAGDVVGYGIDWTRQRQFATHNGVRDDFNMCFEQLYERRLFPFACLYAGAGGCTVRANFRGPFLYKIPRQDIH